MTGITGGSTPCAKSMINDVSLAYAMVTLDGSFVDVDNGKIIVELLVESLKKNVATGDKSLLSGFIGENNTVEK
jgi:hypothetical protein